MFTDILSILDNNNLDTFFTTKDRIKLTSVEHRFLEGNGALSLILGCFTSMQTATSYQFVCSSETLVAFKLKYDVAGDLVFTRNEIMQKILTGTK